MSDNIHPVVELLLARIESNPEEFGWTESRWGYLLVQVEEYSSDEERRAIRAALRPIHLDELHQRMMDELFNGDERRAEAERNLMAANRTAQALGSISTIANLGQYQNAIGISTQTPSQSLVINTAGQEAMRIQANGQLNIGGETLDAGMLKKMKSALGLK
jgi:hypothetical protein